MKYASYEYLYPPRPDNAIPKTLIPMIEKRGWIAQAKKNGTCNVIAVSPDRKLTCMNRHKEEHGQWLPSKDSAAAFQALPGKGWYVFVAELLHSKIAVDDGGVRDTNFINDILVCDGEYLVGTTQAKRMNLIHELFLTGDENETPSHYVVNEKTWVAKDMTANFKQFFDSLDKPEDEGLVFKDPKSVLAVCSRQKANVAWSLKSRRAHKNYGF